MFRKLLLALLIVPSLPAMAQLDSVEQLRARAELRYAEGKLEEARQLYHRIAEWSTDPGEKGQALLFAAWLAQLSDRFPEARADLESALEADPELDFQSDLYNEAFVDLFRLAQRTISSRRNAENRGQLEVGVRALDQGDLVSARAAFESVLSQSPNDTTAIYNLALVELESGHRDAAMAGFERIEALALGQPAWVSLELRVRALQNAALLYQQMGSVEDAARTLGKAVGLKPKEAAIWNNLGLALRELGQSERAAEAFRRAFELSPEDPWSSINLAIAYMDMSRWTEAVAILLPATTRHPQEASVWLHLGLAQRGGGELEAASSSLRRARDLDPDNGQGQAVRASSDLALVQLQLDDVVGARDAARRALAWQPNDLTALRVLGVSLHRLGDLEGATRALEQALALDPNDAETHNNLGSVHYASASWDAAEEHFARAVELRPGFSAAEENLGKIRARGTSSTPSPTLSKLAPKKGRVSLGVRFADVDYSALGLAGALIDSVDPGTPAARAGLQKGDLLLRIDGQKISEPRDVLRHLSKQAGDRVALELLRDGRPLQVDVRWP